MVAVGEKTKQIVRLYNDGESVENIALQFGISQGSVLKRLKSYEKISSGFYTSSEYKDKNRYEVPVVWTIENIKIGLDRFISESGHLPTAYEVDDCPYLPSSRQIQRRFGGLSKLREQLGYDQIHLGRGSNRGDSSRKTGLRGGNAEDELEKLLVAKFGELFVQSEKRFGVKRNRIDFLIYAKNALIGIDVFATDEKRTIIKNVAVKIPKYISFPSHIPLFFVVWSDAISDDEITNAVKNMSSMSRLPNLKVVGVNSMLSYLENLEPLSPPNNYQVFEDKA